MSPGVRVAGYLVERNFAPAGPNRLWCADIKYVRTWQGWLYLAAVMDGYSRRIVGWSMRPDPGDELLVDALEMATARRRPQAGFVHHSDQGSQYVSLRFGERCREIGVHRSMGSKGDCFDNAVAESFFATLEKDLLRRRSFATRQEARTAAFDYIETFYNPVRLHSTLDYRSPIEYEKMKEREKPKEPPDQTVSTEPGAVQIRDGLDVDYVSRQLGHASLEITLRIYSGEFDRVGKAERAKAARAERFAALPERAPERAKVVRLTG